MNFLILLISLSVFIPTTLSKNNDVTKNSVVPREPIKLDPNLRKALLKALSDLENEANNNNKSSEEKTAVKAPASAISIFSASEDKATSKPDENTTKKSYVVVQRSQGVQKVLATHVLEKNPLIDPLKDAEQILASASNSFASESNNLDSRSLKSSPKDSPNSLDNQRFITKKLPESTTVKITTTTEENQAKVEQLQFFPAPLVVAFTVHQDEQGLPKKVEPIFKQTTLKQTPTTTEVPNFNNGTSTTSRILSNNNNLLKQQQQALENEILRLKYQQQQQELLLRQQQELFFRQREEIRLRNNAQPFIPIVNPFQPVLNEPTKTVLNRLTVTTPTTTPATPATPATPQIATNSDLVSLQPSISFDPLIEASKLPLNGQILPVKEAGNFRNQLVQIPVHLRQFNALPLQQAHRFFRQETGTGNFVNNGNTVNNAFEKNVNTLSSIQLPSAANFNNFNSVNSEFKTKNVNNGFSSNNNGLNNSGFNTNVLNNNQLPATGQNNNNFNNFNTNVNTRNINNGFNSNNNNSGFNTNVFNNNQQTLTRFNNNNVNSGFITDFNSKNNDLNDNSFNKNFNNGFLTKNTGIQDNGFNNNALKPSKNGLFSTNGFDNQRGTIHSIFDGILTNDFNLQNFQNDFNKNTAASNNNNGFNSNSFAIQQSLQPLQPFHESNFVRNQFNNNGFNNFDPASIKLNNNVASTQRFQDNSALIRANNNVASTGQFLGNAASVRLNTNNFAPTQQFLDNSASIRQNIRPLRSNFLESTLTNNYTPIQNRPLVNNNQLNSLLYKSGAFGGPQSNEDLNIVSKVLSLNHLGGEIRGGFGGFGTK